MKSELDAKAESDLRYVQYTETAFGKFKASTDPETYAAVRQFMDAVKANNPTIKPQSVYSTAKLLTTTLADIGKGLSMTREDIRAYFGNIGDYGKTDAGSYKRVLRRFLSWLAEEREEEKFAKLAKSIGKAGKRFANISDKDIWTPDDFEKVLDAIRSDSEAVTQGNRKHAYIGWAIKDQAMLALMWEGALRPVEVRFLRVEDVAPSSYGEQCLDITIRDTKANPRTITVIECVPYLRQWLQAHPSKDGLLFPTFVRDRSKWGNALSPSGVAVIVKAAAERAGIGKRRNPYILRHSRITDLLRRGMSIDRVADFTGTSPTMIEKTYGHLNRHDTAREYLSQYEGIIDVPEQAVAKRLPSVACPACGKDVPPGIPACGCGHVFTKTGPLSKVEMDILEAMVTEDNIIVRKALLRGLIAMRQSKQHLSDQEAIEKAVSIIKDVLDDSP